MEKEIKEAVYSNRKRYFSTVWIVPITALLIGLVLIVKNISERGPTIEIVFKSATGISEDKSVVKYKDIAVGKVKKVRFDEELKSVIVTVELNKEMKPYLSEKTKFWIVHARLTTNSVEGLDTLFSGAYIGMDPRKGSKSVSRFKGLENPPVVLDEVAGKRFILEANDRSSLQPGSPIYYKKINAGSVISYHLSPDAEKVLIDIFIKAPYDKLVRESTRFWNTSGIDATISADGVNIRTESLTSILSGGLAFDNLQNFKKGELAKEYRHFILFKSEKEASKITYKRELYFWVYFKHSIRGLKQGSSVEFRGIKIGEVVDYFLVGNSESGEFELPVLIKIEPERFTIIGKKGEGNEVNVQVFKKLIDKGFRAQLQSGNLLTGEMFINLEFFEDVPPVKVEKKNGLYVMPTVPATIETLKSDIQTLLNRLSRIPFEEIGENLRESMEIIKNKTLPGIDRAIDSGNRLLNQSSDSVTLFRKETLPGLNKILGETEKAIEEARRNYLEHNSPTNRELIKMLDDISRMSRSIKELTDYLQRHPESIIRGK